MFWRWVELLSLAVAVILTFSSGLLFLAGLIAFQPAAMSALGGIGLLLMLVLRTRPRDHQQEPRYR